MITKSTNSTFERIFEFNDYRLGGGQRVYTKTAHISRICCDSLGGFTSTKVVYSPEFMAQKLAHKMSSAAQKSQIPAEASHFRKPSKSSFSGMDVWKLSRKKMNWQNKKTEREIQFEIIL